MYSNLRFTKSTMSTPFSNKLHPEAKTFVPWKKAPVLPNITVEEVRQSFLEGIQYEESFDGEIDDTLVPSPQVKDGIPVTVYKPRFQGPNKSILVYYHGGGMVFGSRHSVDNACRILSMRSKCIIVNVEYRLAPEHKHPASLDDAVCVVSAVLKNKPTFGGSDSSKVGVAGDSSGGFLAVAVCHEVPGLDFQIPIYPRVNYSKTIRRQSDIEHADDPFLSSALTAWFGNHYIRSDADREDIRLNPYFRDGFDKLPPAMFVVAECDVLRDESYDYAKKLEEAGVKTKLVLIEGACHGFFVRPEHFKECCAKAYHPVVEFILSYS